MACGAGMFGERVQRADEQPILVRQLLMFGAGEFIDSLNDDVGGLIRRIIRRDRSHHKRRPLQLGIPRQASGLQR